MNTERLFTGVVSYAASDEGPVLAYTAVVYATDSFDAQRRVVRSFCEDVPKCPGILIALFEGELTNLMFH